MEIASLANYALPGTIVGIGYLIAFNDPPLALTGGAAARLATLIPPGHKGVIHLTLTDDHPWAQAFVIVEALPE
jgi:ABC-type Fe3+ transport system permease subunit